MTTPTRTQHLENAILQRAEGSDSESFREPLNDQLLPVVSIPINVPLLNHNSFRIAAQLAAHTDRELVRREWDSDKAQAIVGGLILQVHRNIDALRESIQQDGQREVGIITRNGVLINGNTRCILMRELQATHPSMSSLRVAVLPQSFTRRDEIELELVLQQQKSLKDEYRFVNELLMLRELRNVGFTEAQIARRLALRKSSKGTAEEQVKNRLSVLWLMESMRVMTTPSLDLRSFDQDRDNYEVWVELKKEYDELAEKSPQRAEAHLRRWMIAYFIGFSSVHKLRNAKEDWIEEHVLPRLDSKPSIATVVDAYMGTVESGVEVPISSGLEALGTFDEEPDSSRRMNALFQAVVEAHRLGRTGVLMGSDGEKVPITSFTASVQEAVRAALGAANDRVEALCSVEQPYEHLTEARTALIACRDSLIEAQVDPRFEQHRGATDGLAREVAELAQSIVKQLQHDEENE